MPRANLCHLFCRALPWNGLLLLLAGCSPSLGLSGETRYNLQAVDAYILPGYTRLAERTQALAQQAERFCQHPDDSGLQQLREHYRLALERWQFIQPIQLGPIEQKLRSYRLQFWPDKRQSVSRHLAELLDKTDDEALEADNFASGSVAVQGFSALERLLFSADDGPSAFTASETGHQRCRVMRAISRNMADISLQVLNEWQSGESPHRQLVATAATGNAAYRDSAAVSARLFNSLRTQLELMLEQKLKAPMGPSAERARGTKSESWRSGQSLSNLEHNLDGVSLLIRTAFLSRLAASRLSDRIETQLAQCGQALAQIELPLHEAVTDPEQRTRIEALMQAFSVLRDSLTGELAPALEIPLGFNSLDGD